MFDQLGSHIAGYVPNVGDTVGLRLPNTIVATSNTTKIAK
jgi:hypothetical protein